MKLSKIKKVAIVILLFCSVFFAGVAAGVFVLKQKLSDVEFVKKVFLENYGISMECKKIAVGFSGLKFHIESPYVSLKFKNSKKPVVEVKDPFFEVKLLPFFVKRFAPVKFSASYINLNITRFENGEIDIERLFDFSKKSFFKPDLSFFALNIPEYTLSFEDRKTKNTFSVKGNSLNSSGLNFDKKFSLKTQGHILITSPRSSSSSLFSVDIDSLKTGKTVKLKRHEILLSSLDLSFLESYFHKFGFSSLDAKINLFSSSDKDNSFVLYAYSDYINIAFNHNGDLNTIISNKPLINEINFNFSGADLIINSGDFYADKIHIGYFGKIKNIFDPKKINPVLRINVFDSQFLNLLNITPDTLIPFQEPYPKKLKFYKANALVNGGADVDFKNNDDFSVNGKLTFDDVYLSSPPKNAKTSFGDCTFKGRNLELNVYAYAPNDALLTVFGKSRMQKNPAGEYKIKSHGNLDMEFAQDILNPIQDILALKLGPLPFMDLAGDAKIELSTKGTKLKSEVYGWFEAKNAEVKMHGLNTVLKNGSAKILFNGSDIIFNGIKGKIEGADAKIDGVADTLGNMKVDVFVKNAPAKSAMKIAQTSPIVLNALQGGEFLNSFIPESGTVDFSLNLSGNVPPDSKFGEPVDSLLAKGNLKFHDVNLTVAPQIRGTNVNGILNFNNDADFNLNARIFDSPFNITGSVVQKPAKDDPKKGCASFLDIRFVSNNVKSDSIGRLINENIVLFLPSNRVFAENLAKIFLNDKFLAKGDVRAKGLIYSSQKELDMSGFDFFGTVFGLNSKGSAFVFNGGDISLNGKNVKFNKLKFSASKIGILLDGTVHNFASKTPFNNLNITFFESGLEPYIKEIKNLLPKNSLKIFSVFSDYKGTISGKIKLFGNKIDGEFVPKNVSFFDVKNQKKVLLKGGTLKLKNEKTYLNAFNLLYGNLPLYADGFVQTDGDINPEFNIYFTTNITEAFCDEIINPHLEYPVLLTGEMPIKGRLAGRLDSYTSYLTLELNEGSDLSFMGLKLGDSDFKREVSSKVRFAGNHANIDFIRYFKYISSQNMTKSPYDIIKISGDVKIAKNITTLHNLKFETPNPAPVRFLNPLFKKSVLKSGNFTSRLILNGSALSPVITGEIKFNDVFIPLYSSVIDKIDVILNKDFGRANFDVVSFGTNANVTVDFKNSTALPFVINNVSVHSDSVSVSDLMKSFAELPASVTNSISNSQVDSSNVLIKKGSLTVDKILFNGVEANNLKLNFTHSSDGVLTIDNAYLAIAGGLIKGSGVYKFRSKSISVNSDFLNCDANELTKAFFNLTGQIFGNANGNFFLSINEITPSDYVNKINANAEFEIKNGKMPKLGSIEYLLRAGNLIKSGIFGLTLNNVLQLLTPYKHGDFNKINGTFKISNSKINDLKIYSQGDNLSTYTYGTYDIQSANAQIEILGRLSRKVSNLLGPIGNTSVASILNLVTKNKMEEIMKNELLKNINKIPLVGLNSSDYRLFNVKINGKITADDIVKSFNWLN